MLSVAQLYRDRADAENSFDELKNHWGWGGFTTQDLKRCRFMARITALVYNWWSLFVRLADPDRHTEAITSRPLMPYGIGRQTRHAGQTRLTVSSSHAEAVKVEQCYRRIAAFFNELWATAEQFSAQQRWCRILSLALVVPDATITPQSPQARCSTTPSCPWSSGFGASTGCRQTTAVSRPCA